MRECGVTEKKVINKMWNAKIVATLFVWDKSKELE